MRQRDLCREWPQKAQKHKKSGTTRNDQGMRALCDQIRQTAFDLHEYLRNRHLEKGYENGIAHRLRKIGLAVERQRALQVRDEDGAILGDYFADLFVENASSLNGISPPVPAKAVRSPPPGPVLKKAALA